MAVLQQLSRRVSIVGWGSVSPLGCDAGSTWDGVLAERSGIRALTATWSDDLPVRISGCVPDAATASLEPLLLRRSDRCAARGTQCTATPRQARRSEDAAAKDLKRHRDTIKCTRMNSTKYPKHF